MIVLDTTILLYAVGADHPLAAPCATLLRAISNGEARATTTVEVIQEFVHVRARRRNRADAAAMGRDYAVALSPLLVIGEDDLTRGLALFEKAPRLGAFDAVLAAAAADRGMPMASADRGFRGVEGLTHLDPAAAGFLDAAARP